MNLPDPDQILREIDDVLAANHFADAMNGLFQALDAENERSQRWATGNVPDDYMPAPTSERIWSLGPTTYAYWDGREPRVLYNTHRAGSCWGEHCVLHNPSQHSMRRWPMHWRLDRKIFERLCPHGIGHPDPDCISATGEDGTHGCDGCCRQECVENPPRVENSRSVVAPATVVGHIPAPWTGAPSWVESWQQS